MRFQRARFDLRPSLGRKPLGNGSVGQPVWLVCVEPVGTATSRSIAVETELELSVVSWQAQDTGARCVDLEIELSDWRNSHA